MLPKLKKKSILGIDVSSASINTLELSCVDGDYTVEACANEMLPEKAVEGHVIKDIDAVADSIKRALSHSEFTAKTTVLAVPDSAVMTKVVQINEGLTDKEMEEFVVMEADKYIPCSIDEINIDFDILGQSTKHSAMLDVLMVATRAENVNTRVEAVTRAGLEVNIVDVESFAVARVVRLMAAERPVECIDKIIAVIDIGAIYTRLFVLQGMNVLFTREDEPGACLLIDSIAQHYEMTKEQALQAQTSGELPADYKKAVLSPFQERMILQVKRTLQFFYATGSGFVDHIFLAGRFPRQEGLTGLIHETLGIPVSIADPLASMSFGKRVAPETVQNASPSLLIACGLALRHAK